MPGLRAKTPSTANALSIVPGSRHHIVPRGHVLYEPSHRMRAESGKKKVPVNSDDLSGGKGKSAQTAFLTCWLLGADRWDPCFYGGRFTTGGMSDPV